MNGSNENRSSGEDSNLYGKSIVIGLGLAVLYIASPGWLSERAFFEVATTVALFYIVIAPFRSYWATPTFWCALVVLFGAHVALLGFDVGHVLRWGFWNMMAFIAPEWLAMTLILGWLLGDSLFTRDARRERARAIGQEEQDRHARPNSRAQRAGGRDEHGSGEKNS